MFKEFIVDNVFFCSFFHRILKDYLCISKYK